MEYFIMKMGQNMKGNGKMGRNMVKGHKLYIMATNMKEDSGKGKNMDMGLILNLKERNMKENG